MARLAACYFCGIALDEPLEEHPVVPHALREDDVDPATVTLCPTCAEKLEGVLGHVVDALDGTDAPSAAVDPTSEVSSDADDVLVDPDVSADGRTGPTASTGSAGDDSARGDPHDTDPSVDPSGAPAQTDTGKSGSSGTPDGPEDGSASAQGQGGTEETAERDTGSAERAVVEGEHSISALEYNKVMRLLQNREFPIDREEIVTVASSAYGLARADCAHVIDVAIDRGLIEEAGGTLRRPDND